MRTTRRALRKAMFAALMVLLAAVVASAQNRREPLVWMSFFTSGGALSGSGVMVNYIGDDATLRVYKGLGLGVGGEAGRDFGADGGFVLFSGNVSYHFKRLGKDGTRSYLGGTRRCTGKGREKTEVTLALGSSFGSAIILAFTSSSETTFSQAQPGTSPNSASALECGDLFVQLARRVYQAALKGAEVRPLVHNPIVSTTLLAEDV